MQKAWLYSSLLGIATLGVVAATTPHGSADFQFLNGADNMSSNDVLIRKGLVTKVETYNLHLPYEQVWGEAEGELSKEGWKLQAGSKECQIFDYHGKRSLSITPGKVDKNLDFIEGTDPTDTYVVIRSAKD